MPAFSIKSVIKDSADTTAAQADHVAIRTGVEIRSLTGLRGIAACWVLCYHYTYHITTNRSLVGPGYLAVDLFFVLSGFVMALQYSKSFASECSPTKQISFLKKRFARVYPLYVVAVLVCFVLQQASLIPRPGNPNLSVISNIFGVEGLGAGVASHWLADPLDGPTWSISTEFGAYLLFPWLCSVTVLQTWRLSVATAAISFCMLYLITQLSATTLYEGDLRQGPLDVWSLLTLWPLARCLAGFCIGLAVYRASISNVGAKLHRNSVVDVGILALAVVAMTLGIDVLAVAAFALLVWQVSTDQSPFARILSTAPLKLLGDLSYGIYLIHVPALAMQPTFEAAARLVHIPHPWSVSFISVGILVFPAAWLSYHLIEAPSRRMLRIFLDGHQPNAIGASSAAP